MTDDLTDLIAGHDPHSIKIDCTECDETIYNGLGETPPMDSPGFFAEVIRASVTRHHSETDHANVTVTLEPHVEPIDIEITV